MNDKWIDELSEDMIPKTYKELVEVIGIRKFKELCDAIGGTTIYFPKGESVLRPIRDRLIREEFNGNNYNELALKYNLSERWVRAIINPNEVDGQMNILELFSEVNS